MKMKKKNFKKVVFYTDSILGDYTIQELIYFLENQLIRNEKFDKKLRELLTNNGFTNNQIDDLLRIANNTFNLKIIIDMLNDKF